MLVRRGGFGIMCSATFRRQRLRHRCVTSFLAFATYGRAASIQRGQRAFMARSINQPAGATRSINDGPPFFSIVSTATVYQNLGNTGMSAYASGQALAKAFASSVAWGDEEPIANPAFPMLSVMIGYSYPREQLGLDCLLRLL